jgi:hypothetical protein
MKEESEQIYYEIERQTPQILLNDKDRKYIIVLNILSTVFLFLFFYNWSVSSRLNYRQVYCQNYELFNATFKSFSLTEEGRIYLYGDGQDNICKSRIKFEQNYVEMFINKNVLSKCILLSLHPNFCLFPDYYNYYSIVDNKLYIIVMAFMKAVIIFVLLIISLLINKLNNVKYYLGFTVFSLLIFIISIFF